MSRKTMVKVGGAPLCPLHVNACLKDVELVLNFIKERRGKHIHYLVDDDN